jgi:hypothetical protein
MELGSARYFPRADDFYPSLRRGHGTTHPNARIADSTRPNEGELLRHGTACVHETCERTRDSGKGDAHIDKAANVKDWQIEHHCAPIERRRERKPRT